MGEATLDIRIDAPGGQHVARQLQIAAAWTEDLHDPLDESMDVVMDSVRAQFDTEGAHAGHPWVFLSEDYGAWKLEHYPGRPLLEATGDMKAAMLDKSTAVTVGPDEAVYQPVSDIAGFHQAGADWYGPAWGHGNVFHHLPQRKMVDLTAADRHEAVDRVFARWIAGKLRDARAAARVPAAA